jgi:hypothetical protein
MVGWGSLKLQSSTSVEALVVVIAVAAPLSEECPLSKRYWDQSCADDVAIVAANTVVTATMAMRRSDVFIDSSSEWGRTVLFRVIVVKGDMLNAPRFWTLTKDEIAENFLIFASRRTTETHP